MYFVERNTVYFVSRFASPGTRPTNGISIEFEIRPKFGVLWYKMYSTNHKEILHMPWQCNCHDVRNISLWSYIFRYILNKSPPNFARIRSKYGWWDGRQVWQAICLIPRGPCSLIPYRSHNCLTHFAQGKMVVKLQMVTLFSPIRTLPQTVKIFKKWHISAMQEKVPIRKYNNRQPSFHHTRSPPW